MHLALIPDNVYCIVENNTITGNKTGADGGGIAAWDGGFGDASQIRSNIILGNQANELGGGIWEYKVFDVRNNAVAHNIADDGGGIYAEIGYVANNILDIGEKHLNNTKKWSLVDHS